MKTRDLYRVCLIYIGIILTFWALINNYNKNKIIEKLDKNLLSAKSVAVDMYNQRESYIEMVASLNDYTNELENRISVLEKQSEIIKDLRSSK